MTSYEKIKQRGRRGSVMDWIIGSNAAILVIAIVGILLGAVIAIATPWAGTPVSREDALAYSGGFLSYGTEEDAYVILFEDGGEYWLDESTETPALRESLETMERGTVLHLLVDPRSDCVLELRTDTEELLRYDDAYVALKENATVGIVVGIVLAALGAFLILFVLLRVRDDRLETTRMTEKAERRGESDGDVPLRAAESDPRCKILLEARVGEYSICYRRLRHVNELVVNGSVYDEKRGILEFAHTLTAVIDGHRIEAGLDSSNFSFIIFDGHLVVNRLRLI